MAAVAASLMALLALLAPRGIASTHAAPDGRLLSGATGAAGANEPAALATPGANELAALATPAGQQSLEELQARYQEAVEAMETATSPSEPVRLFSQLISTLEGRAASGELGEEEKILLADCYEGRALTRFAFLEREQAEDDIRALIRLRPEHDVERSVTPTFVELFDRLQAEMVGTLQIDVQPQQVDLTIDGEPADPFQRRHEVLAGGHTVTASRAGHGSASRQVQVEAGGTQPVEITLERESAVLAIRTRPTDATVFVDGRRVGATSGSPSDDFIPRGEAGNYPVDEFSRQLLVDGLAPGTHEIRVEKEGFRAAIVETTVDELADYELPPILLERTEGFVLLENLPEGAAVEVNGETVDPERPSSSEPARLALSPGEYRVQVQHGTAGTFEREVTVEDRQRVTLQIVLRPAVALLGILGGDEMGASNLSETLRSGFESRDQWNLLDRTEGASQVLEELGMTTETLRSMAAGSRVESETIDWSRVQRTVDERVSGSVYVLAVLDDDLLARHADLWVWPAAPGPATPDRLRVSLEDASITSTVLDSFSVSLLNNRPWLGATVVDSLGDRPMVVSVTPGGPAEAAGIQTGDRLVSIGGSDVAGAEETTSRILEAGPDAEITVTVERPGGQQAVTVRLGRSPMVLPLNTPDRVYAAVWAAASAELDRPDSDIPDWVLQLNMAATQIHAGAWGDAVNTLRRIQNAPTAPGLGQAAVQYWLGIALNRAGASYLDAAREALQQAANDPDARLYHHDGPRVAPRARARLAVLGAS